jgi:hypothetical protein
VLETKTPRDAIFRIARKPDPWQPPDWSLANPDGTFGNRFDDPEGYYRVLYAASQELSCFLETLARYRPDPSLLAELNKIDGENDFFPLGCVPREWCAERLLGSASAEGNYAEIYVAEWIALLRQRLAGECLRLGVSDLDASILQSHAPRRITQLASLEVWRSDFDGIFPGGSSNLGSEGRRVALCRAARAFRRVAQAFGLAGTTMRWAAARSHHEALP